MRTSSIWPWAVITLTLLTSAKTSNSRYLKRALMDPGNCESFCLSSGFQGSVGSCNCGYIMFSKRSLPPPTKENRLMHNILATNFDKLTGNPTLEELSTEEVVNALNVLETINNGLTENQLKLLLWIVNWIDAN